MMTVKEAAERVRAFADHRALDNIRTDWDAPWREAMKVCATAVLEAPRTEARRNGWQLVPIEPTTDMLESAGRACDGLNLSDFNKIGKAHAKAWYRWREMLAAAPSVESPQREKP